MVLLQQDTDYFERGRHENPKFWSRFGNPCLKGLTILDFGCGHGSLCIDAAFAGAKEVVGLDLDSHRIEFARENLRINYSELKDTVRFIDTDIRHYNRHFSFDCIVCKDSFEHIMNLEQLLSELKERLKPGGKIYAGFGPLYNSVYGGHRRMGIEIPWGHLIIPESRIINRLNKTRENKIESIYDLGLNKLGLRDYKRIFANSGLTVASFRVNHSKRLVSRLFSLFRKIPGLEEYFSHNIYCVLEKRG